MKVLVQLDKTSQPIEHEAESTYEKGDFFCVKVGEKVFKYPKRNIFRVVEDYGKSLSRHA